MVSRGIGFAAAPPSSCSRVPARHGPSVTISTNALFTILAVPSDMRLPLQRLRHADSRDRCIRVLPESQHRPAGCPQLEVSIPVSESIRLNLRAPPTRVGLRPCAVLGTAMPKTPIHKHRDLRSHEGDVRPAARARQRHVDSVTQTKTTKGCAQGDLAGRIAPASSLHSPTNFCRRRLRSRRLLRGLLLRCLRRCRAVPRHLLPT
jgi:hypothetical protein